MKIVQHPKYKNNYLYEGLEDFVSWFNNKWDDDENYRYAMSIDVFEDDGSMFGERGRKYIKVYSDGFYVSSKDIMDMYLELKRPTK